MDEFVIKQWAALCQRRNRTSKERNNIPTEAYYYTSLSGSKGKHYARQLEWICLRLEVMYGLPEKVMETLFPDVWGN